MWSIVWSKFSRVFLFFSKRNFSFSVVQKKFVEIDEEKKTKHVEHFSFVQIDAIDFYEKLYKAYKDKLEIEYSHVREKKCGLAFVTFATAEQSHR